MVCVEDTKMQVKATQNAHSYLENGPGPKNKKKRPVYWPAYMWTLVEPLVCQARTTGVPCGILPAYIPDSAVYMQGMQQASLAAGGRRARKIVYSLFRK